MENNFIYSLDNKRYHTLNYHLRQTFNSKIFKVSLNAGFTCPNIDGTKGVGGCSYCSPDGSGDFGGDPKKSITEQFNSVKEKLHKKWPEAKYIAYFQAHTNTYAPLDTLKKYYETALSIENVVGLSIATRADCISKATADYLSELSNRTYLEVELGLQTTFDSTAKKINRCHSYADFLKGYDMLKKRGINICVHIINGLPGETHEMMVENIKKVAKLRPHSVKIHLLHIIKGTAMENELKKGEVKLLDRDEYVNIVCDQLEALPPETVIQRITGDGDINKLIGPLWSLKKFCVMNEIDKEMLRRDSFQGKYFTP